MTQDHQRATGGRGVLTLGCAAAAVAIVAVLAYMGHSFWSAFRTRASIPDMAHVRRVVPFQLPASATLLDSYQECSREMVVLARLHLPRKEVKGLLNGLPPGSQVSRSGEMARPFVESMPAWWTPDAVSKHLHVSHSSHGSGYGELLISLTGQDRVVVYLHWYSV